MKKVVLIIVAIIEIIILEMLSVTILYNIGIKPVKIGDEVKHTVEIAMGSGTASIANTLKKEGLINSTIAFRLYVKLNNMSDFQAGTYELTKSMSVEEITQVLQTGKVISQDVISITFIEGKNMKWVANKIAETTNNTENDVYKLLKDENYIDSLIKKYWFITSEVKNKDIYYPLEGYFFPDTYEFNNKDVTVEFIFETLLNQMQKKLEPYKKEIEASKYSVHELLALASIIENEAAFEEDRKDISSVIYNRLNSNMAVQCDATTYYAFQIDMGTRDLYLSELNTENPYNTRGPNMEGKLPVGPISMVGLSSLEAAIYPNTTSYLFFVADKNGKIHFTKTDEEHSKKIEELKNAGLWIEY